MVEATRYIVGGLIALIGAWFIVASLFTIFTKREGRTSLMPFIGPLAFIGGVAITPLPFSHWLWLAFLVDINTIAIPSMVMFLFLSSEDE